MANDLAQVSKSIENVAESKLDLVEMDGASRRLSVENGILAKLKQVSSDKSRYESSRSSLLSGIEKTRKTQAEIISDLSLLVI
jgi:hypothetical protein